MTMKKLGVIMDSFEQINVHKDSTLALLQSARQQGWSIFYWQLSDLFWREEQVWASMRRLQHLDLSGQAPWWRLSDEIVQPLTQLQVILMRKDPPIDRSYWYATQLLDHVSDGVLMINCPQSLRDFNEKLLITYFPQCCVPILVTQRIDLAKQFLNEQKDVVVKPLHNMGGRGVLRLKINDLNCSVILEMLTEEERTPIMLQQYIPEIIEGDKRVILIDGLPIDYALARIPASGELRGNLAAGARAQTIELSDRDRWICAQVGPFLRERGILLAGLDIIGDYLTEINITSPTCIRQIDEQCGLEIGARFMQCVNAYLA
jgi:glutathione synthase